MIDAALWAARLLQFACSLGIFGVVIFHLYEREPALPGAGRAPQSALPRWLLPLAAAIGALSTLAWLSCEAATIAGSPFAVAEVVTGTRIGFILVARALLFAAMLVLLPLLPERARWISSGVLAGLITASFAWTGHGSAGDGAAGRLHQAADALHLLAAGAWIGALVEFCARVRLGLRTSDTTPARALLLGLSRFSATGPAIVAVLVVTGVINSWVLIGPRNLALLFTTPYGLALMVKLGLFAGMLALAAINRRRLTPRLQAVLGAEADADAALKALRRSLIAETALGLLVLAAVAWLGVQVPPADA